MAKLHEYQWRGFRSTLAWPPRSCSSPRTTAQWRARGTNTGWHWGAWDSPGASTTGSFRSTGTIRTRTPASVSPDSTSARTRCWARTTKDGACTLTVRGHGSCTTASMSRGLKVVSSQDRLLESF
uniref:Uncharacterized protein n=1 Tax=Timema tahoe TaxID=61484 RepID=A0A7R9IP88_9NEOP|nr:unnamed protein product [Timema tahoe]